MQPQTIQHEIKVAGELWKKNQSDELKEALKLLFKSHEREHQTFHPLVKFSFKLEDTWRNEFGGKLPWE